MRKTISTRNMKRIGLAGVLALGLGASVIQAPQTAHAATATCAQVLQSAQTELTNAQKELTAAKNERDAAQTAKNTANTNLTTANNALATAQKRTHRGKEYDAVQECPNKAH